MANSKKHGLRSLYADMENFILLRDGRWLVNNKTISQMDDKEREALNAFFARAKKAFLY
jgi:hypothetical protein